MNRVYDCIDKLLSYAKCNLGLNEKNSDYVRNSIFALFKLDSYVKKEDVFVCDKTPEKLLSDFLDAALDKQLFEDYEAEYYLDQIMGFLSLMPSEVEDIFYKKNKIDSKEATEWFYDYCVKNDYVKKSKLDSNPRFDSNGLVITINKAKPEFRDPKKAQSGNSTKGGYPRCSICHENEGFAGRSKKTLRSIDLTLDGEKWFWQFSPYGYFYQHGIAVNYEHTPMHVDKDTFKRLISFVDQFPQWFIGSNAALPRIGGSVLAHDHYQGGGEILPLMNCNAYSILKNKEYKDAVVEIVDWPGSVVRVVSKNKDCIINISEAIRNKWVNYENLELGIVLKDEDGVHSAISPTVIKTDRGYEMTIILRNNITNETYPDGVFHAHPEFHVIKKESIGLIEAQGLFILPGRLENELARLCEVISKKEDLPNDMADFKMIYDEVICLCNNDFTYNNVDLMMKEELGSICYRILENTAVFKDKKDLKEFMEDLGFYE